MKKKIIIWAVITAALFLTAPLVIVYAEEGRAVRVSPPSVTESTDTASAITETDCAGYTYK